MLIVLQSRLPMGPWEIVSCTLCIAFGAGCSLLPYILEHRVIVKLAMADRLADVTSEIQNLDAVAAQIGTATSRWQTVQESADKTAAVAKEIAGRMAGEVQEFNRFLQASNDGEKSALRLEVEKLRRAESDWLQALVRMLDHVYAVHQGAVRSQQPTLIDQLGQFQNACRDAARRVGLAPFVPGPDEPFDPARHQLVDGGSSPESDAVVSETVAAGYTFQGKLLRPALVRLGSGRVATPAPGEPGIQQSTLGLDPASRPAA